MAGNTSSFATPVNNIGSQKYTQIQIYLKNSSTGQTLSHTVDSICARAKPTVDIYIPPLVSYQGIDFGQTICFKRCRSSLWTPLSTLPVWNAPGVSPCKRFYISFSAWTHIDQRHVFEYDVGNYQSYLTARCGQDMKKNRGTNCYIHSSVVFPLMFSTLTYPDHVFHDSFRNRLSFLKLYSSEIGHDQTGACCFINKVVVGPKIGSSPYSVVTAFPVLRFF